MATRDMGYEKLLGALRGGDPDIGRGKAFELLAASDYPHREERLASVLQDVDEALTVRAAAASALGRIPTRTAEQVLLPNLAVAEPRVRSAVLLALGRIGTAHAVAAIDEIALAPRHPNREDAVFAAALISYRLGLPGHALPMPAEDLLLQVPAARSQAIRTASVPERERAMVIADLERQPHGIVYDPEKLVLLDCAGRVNVLCPNREFSVPGGVERLTRKKAIVGVVALKSPETGHYSVCYLLMSAPAWSAGRVDILVPRCSARPGLAGSGEISGDRAHFRLNSVARPGAWPIELDGEFTAAGLVLRRAVIALDALPARRPALSRPYQLAS